MENISIYSNGGNGSHNFRNDSKLRTDKICKSYLTYSQIGYNSQMKMPANIQNILILTK